MFEVLDIEKMIQAAAVLLRQHGRSMSYLRLLSLLYLADRESIRQKGWPIVGHRVVATKYGPLHGELFDLVRGEHPQTPEWSRHFDRHGYAVTLTDDPGVMRLSKHDIQVLNEIAERYRELNDWDIVESTHGFDEWRNNYHDGSSQAIPYRDIVTAVGFSTEDVTDILAEIEDAREAERLHQAHSRQVVQ